MHSKSIVLPELTYFLFLTQAFITLCCFCVISLCVTKSEWHHSLDCTDSAGGRRICLHPPAHGDHLQADGLRWVG
jgi:hypothetical protein